MTDLQDDAWHALFHMLDAFDPIDGALPIRHFTDYQLNAMAEAKRVMDLLEKEDDQ